MLEKTRTRPPLRDTTPLKRLSAEWKKADDIDINEGIQAYFNYHKTMQAFADHYGHNLDVVTAAFCALSPNSDYKGNLRSLASVLDGINDGVNPGAITVSTYNHCKDRAIDYVLGRADFEDKKRGLKILNFYRNILRPYDPKPVTIDGHMIALHMGEELTMKEAKVSRRGYERMAQDFRELAKRKGLLPNQAQATLWFVRKRTRNIKYDSQLQLFNGTGNAWETFTNPLSTPPYVRKAI